LIREDNNLAYYNINELTTQLANDTAKDIEHEKILFYINQKIASKASLEEIINFLFIETQSVLPTDRMAVSFFEEDGNILSMYYVVASYKELHLKEGYRADISNSSLYEIFKSVYPRIIGDLELYYKKNPKSKTTELLLKEGIMSNMTCPLLVNGRPIGLLFRSSKEPHAYSEESINFHFKIIERISQAVEKTYIIKQLQNTLNSYLETLSFVSHELKSPLDSIITLGNTLTAGYFGKVDEKISPYIQRMVKKAQYLRGISDEYLTLSQIENQNIKLKILEVNFIVDILQDSIEIITPLANEKNIKIEIIKEDIPPIFCDMNQIKIVVNNLLSNAVKYSNENGLVKITVSKDSRNLNVSIWNNGPGFPDAAKNQLFRKFSRIDKKELLSRKGTGIGLYSVWKIIKLHKGKIVADSEEGKWAEFSFSIPAFDKNFLKFKKGDLLK